MKFFIPGILIIIAASCTNTSKLSATGLKGRLAVSELCSHYIVEVTGGSIAPEKTAANWTDDKRKATYAIAFTVANRCSFAKAGLAEGDEFSFSVDETNQPETCAVCMAYYPTPSQTLAITNIQKLAKNK
ncbi:MAG: hypothetical protein KF862_18370 [Chitinophagaceae bacterium]|nr:hypothetical protein [Chitinophagaceae bacterium]